MREVSTKSTIVLHLGKQGENRAAGVVFHEPREWAQLFGDGHAQLLNQRPGETSVYPVALEEHSNGVLWVVTAADTEIHGSGKCELRYLVDDVVVKSKTYSTRIQESVGGEETAPPEPQQGWVDQVLQAGAAVQTAADRAEAAAIHQPYPNAGTGTWWLWNVETGAYVDSGERYDVVGGGDGTTDHTKLSNRGAADQHPMSAITGLTEALAGKQPTSNYIPAPATASVGQTIRVSEVDEDGKPTAWEAVDVASGGGDGWTYAQSVTLSENTASIEFTDLPELSDFQLVLNVPATELTGGYSFMYINGLMSGLLASNFNYSEGRWGAARVEAFDDVVTVEWRSGNSLNFNNSFLLNSDGKKITSFEWRAYNEASQFPAGTVINVRGK